MRPWRNLRGLIVAAALAAAVLCVQWLPEPPARTAPEPLFYSNDPRAVYAADVNDSWNRIFRLLFTRTAKVRLAREFAENASVVRFTGAMAVSNLSISKAPVERTEIGDHAIEPLYPSFFTHEGLKPVLTDSGFAEFERALTDALNETNARAPNARALMQSDAWAAYDAIFAIQPPRLDRGHFGERKATLLRLLQQFIKKLALTSEQIKSLKSNYADAITIHLLPDLFSSDQGWLEIELLPHRLHDDSANFRRVARVFVKPRKKPSDEAAFVESLKHQQHLEEVEAVGLLVQNLLLNDRGEIVSSPIFSEIQFRFFENDNTPRAVNAEVSQFELSRKLLLTDPRTGGLFELNPNSPAYLGQAGNDYSFMSPIERAGAAVLVPLRTRCVQCHGESLTTLMTYSIHDFPPVPKVKVLDPTQNPRAVYVAAQKQLREDFKSLMVGDK